MEENKFWLLSSTKDPCGISVYCIAVKDTRASLGNAFGNFGCLFTHLWTPVKRGWPDKPCSFYNFLRQPAKTSACF